MPQLSAFDVWTQDRVGLISRGLIMAVGLISATLVLMMATLEVDNGWTAVPMGAVLAAISSRTATKPTPARMLILTIAIVTVTVGVRQLLNS